MMNPATRLFLSYGRGDDEPFVERLYQRLQTAGFDVWWDRLRMPSRALTFLKEIRDAIRAADRIVVVIGPSCVVSDYCRAEWQAALAEAKVVNPVLRLGSFELLPPELRSFHCPDARDDGRIDAAFTGIARVLAEPIPSWAHCSAKSRLAATLQPRPDSLSALAAAILSDHERPIVLSGSQRMTVLHGMGGSGKSVLAGTFARSTSTRRSFADGVYWLEAGQRTPLQIAASLGRLLGTPASHHGDLAAGVSDLTAALAARSVLLVVDDAWRIDQLEPLLDALGPSCRVLVTTRIGELATSSDAGSVEVRELSPEAAVQQLADWAGVAPGDLPQEAVDVAAECGQLPFALALNGAMHQSGVPWRDLLSALRAAEIDYAEGRLKGYPYPTVLRSLKVSLDALDSEDAAAGERLRELVAFHGDAAVSEAAVAVLWGDTGGLKPHHVGKLLAKLAGRALIRLDGGPGTRRVLLHDLQRDYLLRLSDAGALNEQLLSAYEKSCRGDWPSLLVDGYIHGQLAAHLLDAERIDAVRALLDRSAPNGANAWFDARAAIDDVLGYLSDLERARAKMGLADRRLRLIPGAPRGAS